MAKKEMNKEKKKNNFFKDLKAEMKKVTWPTFKKLVNNTFAVVSIVLILSIIVFVLGVCFENLNKFGVEKLKSLVSSETENQEEGDEAQEATGENNDLDGSELAPDEGTDETAEENNSEPSETDSELQTDNTSEEVTQ